VDRRKSKEVCDITECIVQTSNYIRYKAIKFVVLVFLLAIGCVEHRTRPCKVCHT